MRVHTTPRQLALPLTHAPSFASDDFLVADSNAQASKAIESWPAWPDNTLLLVGPAGSGKSHLAAIWRERAGAENLEAAFVPRTSETAGPVVLCLDDADRRRPDDAGLFHAINLVHETGGALLLTARTPPNLWGATLPDLLSRLRRMPMVRIEEPDDSLLRAVIVKLFTDQQIVVDGDVVSYLAKHCERSVAAVRTVVAHMDAAALEGRRRVTRALAAAVLDRLEAAQQRDD